VVRVGGDGVEVEEEVKSWWWREEEEEEGDDVKLRGGGGEDDSVYSCKMLHDVPVKCKWFEE